MITNADLLRAQRQLRAAYETLHTATAQTQSPRSWLRSRRPWLALIWLLFAVTAFLRHPHLSGLPVPLRLFWSLFGVWSLPAWDFLGAPVWNRVLSGQLSANLLWWSLYGSLFPMTLIGVFAIVSWRKAQAPARQWQHVQQELHRIQQGRLRAAEAAARFALAAASDGLPLAQVTTTQRGQMTQTTVGVPFQREMGHCVVIAPTRAGKGLHLTDVLRQWQHAAIVIDPKGEQCERTAGLRQALGEVYNIPHHSVDLSRYYDWSNRNDLTELHRHMLRPEADHNSIFAEKSRVLFDAAGKFAMAHGLNPLHVLLAAGNGDMRAALTAWETVARDEVRTFTNGHAPSALDDRFVSSAWGTLTTRLYTYFQEAATLTTGTGPTAIPLDWAAQNGTVYVTYPLGQLTGVGGAMAALIAGMMRHHIRYHPGVPLLVAIDELPAVGLRNVLTYLATVGGYGVTLLLYAQTYGQLVQLYGREGAETLLANCRHQVWYPPADPTTAERMARLYGTELKTHVSFGRKRSKDRFEIDPGNKGESRNTSMRKELVLDANAVMALDAEQVLCRIERRFVVQAQRMWPVEDLTALSAIPLTRLWPSSAPRLLPLDWGQIGHRKPTPNKTTASSRKSAGFQG